MSRRPISRPTLCHGEIQPRRSARIQQQREQSSVNPLRRERTTDNAKTANENVKKKRRREDKDDNTEKGDRSPRLATKKRSSRSDTISETVPTKGNRKVPVKRGVRFDDDDALEELPDDCVAQEDAARAAAAAVTPESLASRPENAQYATLGPREIPCPPDAVTRITPSRTLDSKGRVLLQYPIRYILAYRIEVGDLYNYLKSVKRDFHDFQGTLLYFQLQLDEELDMRRSQGMNETVYMGERVWTMVMSQSDRPETLPYPTQRIRKFQEIMGCTSQPIIYPFRPRAHRIHPRAK